MKKYYILTSDPSTKWYSIIDYDLCSFSDISLRLGKELENPPPVESKLFLANGCSKKWPDYLTNPLSWRLFSTKFKDVIEPFCDGNSSFFSINSNIAAKINIEKEYWLGSIFFQLPCMDLEKSEYRERNGRISSVTKLVLDSSRIPESCHLFLLKERPTSLIIDDIAANEIVTADIKGIAFISVSLS